MNTCSQHCQSQHTCSHCLGALNLDRRDALHQTERAAIPAVLILHPQTRTSHTGEFLPSINEALLAVTGASAALWNVPKPGRLPLMAFWVGSYRQKNTVNTLFTFHSMIKAIFFVLLPRSNTVLNLQLWSLKHLIILWEEIVLQYKSFSQVHLKKG